MIVTFKTKAYRNITMFGDIAVHLLKLMGQTGKVPGAIKDDDIGAAYQSLKRALAQVPDDLSIDEKDNTEKPRADSGTQQDYDDNEEEEQSNAAVSLKQRARPLLDLLEAAAKDNAYVSWE